MLCCVMQKHWGGLMNKHQFGHRSEKGIYLNSSISSDSIVTGKPRIEDSIIKGRSVISDKSLIRGSIVFDSIVSDETLLRNCAVINSTILNDATIYGFNERIFIKDSIIVEGTWFRPPITYTLPTGWIITESIDDRVTVSCTTNKIDKWLSGAGARYGKLVGMSQDEIDVCLFYIRQIKEIKEALNEL